MLRTSALLLFLSVSMARAELTLPAVISDHMVLQANQPATLWGWAKAGDTITVEFAGHKATAIPDTKDGRWQLDLAAMPPSKEGRTLSIATKDQQLQIKDVLVGEVWIGSGQSNMEMQIQGKMHGSVDNAEAEIAAANFPEIRMFMPDAQYEIYQTEVPPATPARSQPGRWHICSPQTVANFSAMGYFVARDIAKHTGGPVGVLSVAVGGTPVEAWTSLPAQKAVPAFEPLLADWQKRLTNFDPVREQNTYLAAKEQWLKTRAAALKEKQPAPKAPLPFKNLAVMNPGVLFNGCIAPLIPYRIRGVIWYQGERNAAGPFTGLYGEQLKALIQDWRAQWKSDFYFAWVQLPGFQKPQVQPSEPKGWGVAVREGQQKALSVPNTGMAITIDIGGEKAGHPTNKAEFATRLSTVVLHDVYQSKTKLYTGPLLESSQVNGEGRYELAFDHASGLKAKEGKLEGFAIAGADKKFIWAKAKVEKGKVIVWHEKVPAPASVRYAWAANPKGNLVNAAGLPASPFRTDDWPTP